MDALTSMNLAYGLGRLYEMGIPGTDDLRLTVKEKLNISTTGFNDQYHAGYKHQEQIGVNHNSNQSPENDNDKHKTVKGV